MTISTRWSAGALLSCLGLVLLCAGPAAAQNPPTIQGPSAQPTPSINYVRTSTTLTAVPIKYRPSPAVQGEMKKIIRDFGNKSRRSMATEDVALAYLVLASGGDRPKLVAHALKGMGRSWSRKGHFGAKINDDFVKVVRARTQSGPKRVRVAAFLAASLLFGTRAHRAGLDDVLTALRSEASTVRFFAARTLFNEATFQTPERKGPTKKEITAALLPLLDDPKPSVIAATADVLGKVAYPKMPLRNALLSKAKTLVTHPKAKVRGTAMVLWYRLAKKGERKELIPVLRRGLLDPHGYVRANAAQGLAELKHVPAIHDLVTLLDDKSKSHLKLKKGHKYGRQLILKSTAGRQVRAVALHGIIELSKSTKKRLRIRIDSGVPGPKLDKSLRKARAYYKAQRKRFPKAEPAVSGIIEKTGSAAPPPAN